MSARAILLTGASSGMGRLIAKTMAAQGHRVFAGMRDLHGRNAPNAAELANAGGARAITPVELDVTDGESVRRCVASVLADGGGIDVLVNCAGIMWVGTTEAFSTEQFETVLQTNVVGPFRLCKAVLPAMRAAGHGLIISVTSTCGRIVPPNFGIYCASKYAMEALAESIAYETADLGIDSVIVEPGAFDTGLLAAQVDPRDSHIVAEYGAMGGFDGRLSAFTRAAMKDNPAEYDPQIVADAVAELIAMPRGARPLRRPVGRVGAVPELNRHFAKAQAAFLSGVGLGHLAAPASEVEHG